MNRTNGNSRPGLANQSKSKSRSNDKNCQGDRRLVNGECYSTEPDKCDGACRESSSGTAACQRSAKAIETTQKSPLTNEVTNKEPSGTESDRVYVTHDDEQHRHSGDKERARTGHYRRPLLSSGCKHAAISWNDQVEGSQNDRLGDKESYQTRRRSGTWP